MERSRAFEAALVIILIVLAALLYFMIVSTPQAATGWETDSCGNIDYMFVGSDDTLYTFSGNVVSAMSKDGIVLWQQSISPEWRVLNDWDMPVYTSSGGGGLGKPFRSYPVAIESNGSLYLFAIYGVNATDVEAVSNSISLKSIGTEYHYLSPDIPYISKPAVLMKISADGTVAWNYSFLTNLSTWNIGGLVKPDYYTMQKPIAMRAAGDRIYLFHDYMEDVLDANGRLIFSIQNVSAPVAIDELGRIYSVRAVHPTQEQYNQSMLGDYVPESGIAVGWDPLKISGDLTYMLTSSIVEAYNADGNLLWSCDIGRNATRPFLEQEVWQYYNTLPLYSNEQLYVPFEDGVTAIGLDGKIKWTARISDGVYSYFPLMPIDSQGNLYMMKLDEKMLSCVETISPEGQVSRNGWPCYAWPYYEPSLNYNPGPVPAGAKDGIIYAFVSRGSGISGIGTGEFEDMLASLRFYADTIRAYDIVHGTELWNFTIPMADKHAVTLNEDNTSESILNIPFFSESDIFRPPSALITTGKIKVYPGKDVLYLSYYYSIFESPLLPDKSRCVYARGFYALDNNGKLLWEKQVNGTVEQVAVGNRTVYYTLDNGRIGGSSLNIAAGAAITAFAYLFLRFFMIGSVARARNRLEQNENRNRVLHYVIDNPGVTAADIAKGLKINMGTIRYHLFILTANHKVVTHQEDGKFLRYFKNSGAYTREERDFLSVIRRKPLQKILLALIEKQTLSVSDLAMELDISVTAVNRHVSELVDRGIVEKLPGTERGYAYAIKARYSERIKELLGQL